MKKKVMQRAWQLAKQGAKQFGGKAKEYFAISLRMAWAEIKEESAMKEKESIYIMGTVRRGIDYNDYYTSSEMKKDEAVTEYNNLCKEWDKVNPGNGYKGQLVGAECAEITPDGKVYVFFQVGNKIGLPKKVWEIRDKIRLHN